MIEQPQYHEFRKRFIAENVRAPTAYEAWHEAVRFTIAEMPEPMPTAPVSTPKTLGQMKRMD